MLQDVFFPRGICSSLVRHPCYTSILSPASALQEHKAEAAGRFARCFADRLVSAVPDPDAPQHRLGRFELGDIPGTVHRPGGGVRAGLGGIRLLAAVSEGGYLCPVE